MTVLKIYSDLATIADQYQGVLLDAYGVFWGGNDTGIIPGSIEAMRRLVNTGKTVGILSNSTQLASKEGGKFEKNGLVQGTHYHFLVTSGEVARQVFLKEQLPFVTARKSFWLFGGVHPKFASHEAIFEGSAYRETDRMEHADFIYLSIPHINGEDQIDQELFRPHVAQLLERGLPMVCPNPDQVAHEGRPARAVIRQGTIARMYEELGGEVFYIGKPQPQAYIGAMDRFQSYGVTDPRAVLMIGDTPETDVRGARRFGMSSALITGTGIMADRISHQGWEGAWQALAEHDRPTYLLRRLGE